MPTLRQAAQWSLPNQSHSEIAAPRPIRAARSVASWRPLSTLQLTFSPSVLPVTVAMLFCDPLAAVAARFGSRLTITAGVLLSGEGVGPSSQGARVEVDDGDVRVEYRIVSFLDQASTNDYSSRAANALVAAYDAVLGQREVAGRGPQRLGVVAHPGAVVLEGLVHGGEEGVVGAHHRLEDRPEVGLDEAVAPVAGDAGEVVAGALHLRGPGVELGEVDGHHGVHRGS